MQLAQRITKWINADFVRWRKQRTWVEPLVKQQLRRTADVDAKVVLIFVRIGERTCYHLIQRGLRGCGKRKQMQLAIRPNATLHSRVFVFKLKWLKPDHERGNHFARVSREDRHGYHFIDSSIIGLSIILDVPDLLRVRQFVQSKLRFSLGVQLSYGIRIERFYYRALSVEEAIKFRMKPL